MKNASGPPLVTAILPAWNAADFVEDTLRCLDAQNYPNLEVWAADDGSTDATPEILRQWAAERDHVSLICRGKNLGWVANCNDLMSRARGKYMFFAFHDDQVAARYVSELVTLLEKDPEVILAYATMKRVGPGDSQVSIRAGNGAGLRRTPYARAAAMITGGTHWGVPNRGLFRTEAFRQIGGMRRNAAGEFSADFPWLLAMLLRGRFAHHPQTLYTKRLRPGSLSQSWSVSTWSLKARDRSAAREIWRSRLTVAQKVRLCRLLKEARLARLKALQA